MVQPFCDRKMHLGALDRGQLRKEEFNTPKLAATVISRNPTQSYRRIKLLWRFAEVVHHHSLQLDEGALLTC